MVKPKESASVSENPDPDSDLNPNMAQVGQDAAAAGVGTATALASEKIGGALERLDPDPEISGPLNLVLSQELRDAMSLELREALEQIEQGFGDLTKPGDIFNEGQPFHVINAVTIDDYLDKTTGELKVKHVFQLEFDGGLVKNMMQSTARPRKAIAEAFRLARGLGGKLRMGPYRMVRKAIPNQIQPAYIFEQQKGFAVRSQ